jgi:hypothetical protein
VKRKIVMNITKNILATIVTVAHEENEQLRKHGKGIFFMPELAFSYLVGKRITSEAIKVFGTQEIQWLPETNIGGGGPSDVVFKMQGQKSVVIEMKMRTGDNAYYSDVCKLSRLPREEYIKIFCAFVDALKKDGRYDARIKRLEKKAKEEQVLIERIGDFECFDTLDDAYSSPIQCVIAAWQVA